MMIIAVAPEDAEKNPSNPPLPSLGKERTNNRRGKRYPQREGDTKNPLRCGKGLRTSFGRNPSEDLLKKLKIRV